MTIREYNILTGILFASAQAKNASNPLDYKAIYDENFENYFKCYPNSDILNPDEPIQCEGFDN